MNLFYYDTSLGKLGIAERDGAITHVLFKDDAKPDEAKLCETEALRQAAHELDLYLIGDLKEFSVQLDPHGTPFMKSVWARLIAIPYGKTATYKQIAGESGSPNAFRAVGLANNRNPIPIFIPCHRVVGTNGKLTGYRGGLEMKRRLLELEGADA